MYGAQTFYTHFATTTSLYHDFCFCWNMYDRTHNGLDRTNTTTLKRPIDDYSRFYKWTTRPSGHSSAAYVRSRRREMYCTNRWWRDTLRQISARSTETPTSASWRSCVISRIIRWTSICVESHTISRCMTEIYGNVDWRRFFAHMWKSWVQVENVKNAFFYKFRLILRYNFCSICT